MLIRCLLLSVWRKSGPAQFFPSPSTKYNWCWKIWGGEKTDRVGKKLTGYFFLPGKKLTSQFLPRGRNGPAWSFPGERLAGGKNWPLHPLPQVYSIIPVSLPVLLAELSTIHANVAVNLDPYQLCGQEITIESFAIIAQSKAVNLLTAVLHSKALSTAQVSEMV